MLAAGLVVILAQAPLNAQARPEPVPARKRTDRGTLVLEHDAASFARAPRLGLATPPLTTVGGGAGDGRFDLTAASAFVLTSDGRIGAFASLESRLFIWDTNGARGTVLGRPGHGPGEFVRVTTMFLLPGDTLLLSDFANNRINWVVPVRGVVRSESAVGRLPATADRAVGSLPGGRLVLTDAGVIQPGVRGRVTRTSASIFVLAPGSPGRSVAHIPDLDVAVVSASWRGRPSEMTAPIGFSRTAQTIVWDTLIATSTEVGYGLDLRNSEGRIVRRLTVAAPRRSVSKAMRQADIEAGLARLHTAREAQLDLSESERLRRDMPYADSLPPFGSLFVSPDRTLWIVDAIAPGDTAWSATAFRTDGAILGRLHAAGSARPVAFGNDRVLLRAEDSDGVVTLRVHRIVSSREG